MNLDEHEVHLWLVKCSELNDTSLLNQYRGLLSASELERQQCYALDKLRHRDLLSRVLVRTSLSRYDNINAKAWFFTGGEHGRPEISSPLSNLRFNLSHAEDYIVLAVTRHHDIGIDIEYMQRKASCLKIAAEYFSGIENASLLALPEKAQRVAFYDYWTLKEAYLKACGLGVMAGLDHFGFQLNQDNGATVQFYDDKSGKPAEWFFWRSALENDYRLSLAIRCGSDADMEVSLFNIVPLANDQPH
ncbi:MAG: 4'-phosphopantetheinyl transferase superfamily protein [Gammaproteobacteria bacterium]|nr:4'-phosphopantetheinyl transferase superfamily protein [Gammaproteobacteria bacterium]